MHAYERWTARRYLANALKSRRAKMPNAAADIFEWIETYARPLGLRSLERPVDYPVAEGRRDLRPRWSNWRMHVVGLACEPAPDPSPLQTGITWIADACSLTSSQRAVLGLHVRLATQPEVFALVAAINEQLTFKAMGDAFGTSDLRPFLGEGIDARDLSHDGLLVHLGLIDNRDDLRASELVHRIVRQKRLGSSQFRELLLGAPAAASLGWDDFSHLGDLRDIAARIVAANRNGAGAVAGSNLLFYGEPGTGKSEFAKTLGERLGLSVRFVGEADDRNSEPNRRERIAALMMANALGSATGGVLVVVDEADDLFAGVDEDHAATRHGSKVFMNRLVEKNRTPTIWITNTLDRLGPAVVRRMNLLVRFPTPGLPVRRKIVGRIARRANFSLDDVSMAKLAQARAAPALIENAITASACIGGAAPEALRILESSLMALGRPKIATEPAPIGFDPALSAADVDLVSLCERVVASPSRALSFCLSGPPGTGKSAYARYLAERLELEVLEKRYSSLASMWLGESEKAIAAAFEEAADLRAFLMLDEADSLLRDRAAARHSWEVTQVNELLTWMERHPLRFACTTNAPDLLDPAAARRFLFKIRFLPMSRAQIAAAFRVSFGAEAPEWILQLQALTPGDFAVVVRKSEMLGERDPERVARWLEEEMAAKPGSGKTRIGF